MFCHLIVLAAQLLGPLLKALAVYCTRTEVELQRVYNIRFTHDEEVLELESANTGYIQIFQEMS